MTIILILLHVNKTAKLDQSGHREKNFYHFSFLRDIKVNGIYHNSFSRYLSIYPFLKEEHNHDFFTVLFFLSGNGEIRIDNDLHNVQPRTTCLIAPRQKHSFEGLEKTDGILFFFCQDFYVEEFSFIRLLDIFSCTSHIAGNKTSQCITLSENEFKTVFELMTSIGKEYEHSSSSNNSAVIIRSLLNIMLLRLSELIDSKSPRSLKTDSVFIHELSRLIDSYFVKEHHVAFYASAFNVTEKHLNDICNRHLNCSLKKILKDRLMQEARKLILSTQLSVSEISYKLNFDDNSYFTKVFKKETGLTPKRFRDLHRRLVP